MTEEELRLKLGLDTTELDSGTRRALQNLAGFGQEAHKSFLHGDSAAKGFKKTLHELSDQIPILGYGLRALISWQGAAFAGLAAGIGVAVKALDEYNKKLDEQGERNAQPVSSMPPSKWRGTFRVRDAVANNDPSKSGITDAEAKKQAEAMERWETSKQHAADLVAQRQKDLEDAKSKYKEAGTGASRGDIQTAGGWWSALKYTIGLGPGGAESAKEKTNESDEAYQKALQASRALRNAKDQQARLEGEMPHTISRGLWSMLGLNMSVGSTVRAAYQMQPLLSKFAIDPTTGGVKYRALDQHLLPGSIGYVKPSPGAPGYIPGEGGTDKFLQTPIEKLNQQVAVALMQALTTTGVPVVGKEQ